MNTVTENDLKDLKDMINRVIIQNEQINSKVNNLTVEVAVIRESLDGVNKRFDDVNKRFDDVNKRLDDWKPQITKATDKADKVAEKMSDLSEKVGELKNWRQVAIIVITGLITTLFWLLREVRF
ncbi:hypothetical protein H6G11_13925 [Cyanobacterium aponinum FACHB-4101]|uniref:hypothetical protein n=1 Tax=Cyanobacterium aponinum TaxID=379064 RepID=UPI0016802504|nr:hypothetical protein [Cyanobacterium aponinum]MBD2395348.1 hypothetical protein [Cyanobacterium aponinum FACHB-4101]